MGYWLVSQDSIPSTGKRFSTTTQCPDQFSGPARFLFNGNWRLFPQEYSIWGMELTSRMVKLYFHFPICLYGVVLN
jgi:hypothetical protein